MSDAGCGTDEPRDVGGGGGRGPQRWWEVSELRAAAAAGALLAAAATAGWIGVPGPVELAVEVAALLVGAWTFVPTTLRRLSKGTISTGTLMTIAVVAAVALGETGAAAMLAFLFSIREGLEQYAAARIRRRVRALLSQVAEQATVLRDGMEVTVGAVELRVGDTMLVRPGELLATDGIVCTGCTALDISAITGEVAPIETGPGSEVLAGSINLSGVLQVEVTSTAKENSLAQAVKAERASDGAIQQLADRIARLMVPAVLVVAALIAGIGSVLGDPLVWIERALVVLVAAAPWWALWVPTSRSRPNTRAAAATYRSTPRGLIVGVVVLSAVAAFSYAFHQGKANSDPLSAISPFTPTAQNQDPADAITGVDAATYQGKQHVVGNMQVSYPKSPPFGGAHDATWATCTGVVYAEPIRSETLVHSMEHSAVWIAYNPNQVSSDALATLRGKVEGQPFMAMSPYPGLDTPISLQAWGHQLKLADADDPRIDQFILALRRNPYIAPEPRGTCNELGPDGFVQSSPPPFAPAPAPGTPGTVPEDR